MEAPVPGAPERPADILVHSWKGRPLAVDFSIATPTAPSAARGPTAELLLDTAAVAKIKKNRENCARAGWFCQPFICDVPGTIRSDARQIVVTLINRRLAQAPTERTAEVSKRYWSAVTAAALGRAAVALTKLTAMDSAGLCPGGVLSLNTARTERAVRRGGSPSVPRPKRYRCLCGHSTAQLYRCSFQRQRFGITTFIPEARSNSLPLYNVFPWICRGSPNHTDQSLHSRLPLHKKGTNGNSKQKRMRW